MATEDDDGDDSPWAGGLTVIKVSRRGKPWSPEQVRLARRVAMARWLSQGWSVEFIARVFRFTEAYVRMELAALEADDRGGKAIAMARTGRRLRDPAARTFRRREMFGLRRSGLYPAEIAMFFSMTADAVRQEMARPEPEDVPDVITADTVRTPGTPRGDENPIF